MDCGKAREQVYRHGPGDAGPPSISSAVLSARSHIDQCAACKEFFASEDRIKTLLQDRLGVESVSAELRERILGRIAEQRPGQPRIRKWLGLIAALTATIVLAVTVVHMWNRTPPSEVADFLVEDHVHNLAGPLDISSRDVDVIESWLRQRVDFSFHLPALPEPTVAGGRICQVHGRQAALIHYQFKQNKASMFILDGRGLELPEKQLIPLDGKKCLVESGKGYNVVAWKERGLLYGLVSDANSAELLQMAASF